MERKVKYYIAIVMVFLIAACSDDFLENKPIAMDTTESFYTSYESLDNTATAAYGILCTFELFDIMYSIGYQAASDDVETGGENVNDAPFYQHFDRLIHTASENRVEAMWAYPYKGIRLANEVITRAEEVKDLEIAKVGEKNAAPVIALIDQRVAEMRFMRSFYHFVLMQIYGGVPVVDYIMSPEDLDAPRNSIAEVLHFVQSDLLLALPLLKEKSVLAGNSEVGRASLGAARALLAKAYLYESSYAQNYADDSRFTGCENKYDLALKYAEELIDSEEYELVGINGERYDSWRVALGKQVGGFRWMFTNDADNSDEEVWSVQNVMDGAGWAVTRGNYYTTYTTIRKYELPDSSLSQDFGWSFNCPTSYMVAAFGNADSRETGLNSTPNLDEELDPRFATTVGRPGDSILVDAGSTNMWYPMSFVNLPTKTISRKYECTPDEFTFGANDSYGEGPMNIRLIRFADVVLMAAEAALQTGDNAKALDYVNQVRTRARMSGETNYPENLTAVSFEDIVHERRLELAMESSRFFDLVRWGLAEKFIDGIKLAAYGDTGIDFVPGKHEFFPIPQQEMQKASGLVQYDAWR